MARRGKQSGCVGEVMSDSDDNIEHGIGTGLVIVILGLFVLHAATILGCCAPTEPPLPHGQIDDMMRTDPCLWKEIWVEYDPCDRCNDPDGTLCLTDPDRAKGRRKARRIGGPSGKALWVCGSTTHTQPTGH